jgi:hypothetical protein
MFDELYSMFEGLMDEIFSSFKDDRADSIKAWETGMYNAHSISRPLTEAELVYDDLEYSAWEDRADVEPGWTDGEEAYDVIDMAHWDAEIMSDAASAWSKIKYND